MSHFMGPEPHIYYGENGDSYLGREDLDYEPPAMDEADYQRWVETLMADQAASEAEKGAK